MILESSMAEMRFPSAADNSGASGGMEAQPTSNRIRRDMPNLFKLMMISIGGLKKALIL